MHKFSTNKNRSLKLFSEVFSHLKIENDASINSSMKLEDFQDLDKYDKNLVEFRHKICISELTLENCDEHNDINSCLEKKFYNAIDYENYETSRFIEIYYGSKIKDEKIIIKGYFHETSNEGDEVYAEFAYSNKYNCWLLSKNEIDCNDILTILDFSEY